MKNYQLIIRQLDDKIKPWRQAKNWFQPTNGWIHTIRKSLGITTQKLAKRLGVSRSRIIKIETDEIRKALTLQTLIAVANVLNCDFVYAIIPRKTLQQTINDQAQKNAVLQINKISHNMLLENQALLDKQNQEQIVELTRKLLERSPKKLWEEE